MSYQDLIQPPTGIAITTTTLTTIPPNPNAVSVVSPNGLIFEENANLSNGFASKLVTGSNGIDDFTIVNPYIHYNNLQTVIFFDPRLFLELATIRFNMYSATYRNIS